MEPRGTQALDRALDLLAALVAEGGSLTTIAARLGLALPTAHRLAATLVRRGLVVRLGRGRYTSGPALFALAAQQTPHEVVVAAARPLLIRLAGATGRTAHLGAFDGEMVTYLAREALPGGHVFTREGVQLEAYCSAVGKMLLAMHPAAAREAYLAGGGFVALTARTITDRDALRDHLHGVAAASFATDDEEVADGLFCLAVPVPLPFGAPLALSLAGPVPPLQERAALLTAVRAAAADVAALFDAGADRQTYVSPSAASLPRMS